ncbi:MAG: tetratricopeptide repeat protein [Gemmatimonadaceae bacterium]
MARSALLLATIACSHPPAAVTAAWGTGTTLPHPAQPEIACCSDPKDPHTFIALGGATLDRGHADSAAAAFYWASRLDPTLAHPYYGRSVALLLTYARQVQQPFSDIWLPIASVPAARMAIIDSLRQEALSHDPFLVASYDHLLTGRPPAYALATMRDPAVRGYWSYDLGLTAIADSLLGVALQERPGRARLREIRARAEFDLGRYDSAAAQLRIALDTLTHRDSSRFTLAYSSKEMIHYALGFIHAQRKDTADARRSFESAIVENAAFYPAHARLATLASERGDDSTAARELAVAIELAPNDPTLRYYRGVALLGAGLPGTAVAELLQAIDLDPYFAKPYYFLGKAHEARRDMARAADAYEAYAGRERFNSPERVWAQAYADTLRSRLAAAP